MTDTTLDNQIDEIEDYVGGNIEGVDVIDRMAFTVFLRKTLTDFRESEVRKARNNSLLDLEQWIKLHPLDKEQILDGIEHMVVSNLQRPDQPRLDHFDRLAQLEGQDE